MGADDGAVALAASDCAWAAMVQHAAVSSAATSWDEVRMIE